MDTPQGDGGTWDVLFRWVTTGLAAAVAAIWHGFNDRLSKLEDSDMDTSIAVLESRFDGLEQSVREFRKENKEDAQRIINRLDAMSPPTRTRKR